MTLKVVFESEDVPPARRPGHRLRGRRQAHRRAGHRHPGRAFRDPAHGARPRLRTALLLGQYPAERRLHDGKPAYRQGVEFRCRQLPPCPGLGARHAAGHPHRRRIPPGSCRRVHQSAAGRAAGAAGGTGPRQACLRMRQSGLRSYLACRILAEHGFTCYNFAGGYRFYEAVTTDRCQSDQAFTCGMDKEHSQKGGSH